MADITVEFVDLKKWPCLADLPQDLLNGVALFRVFRDTFSAKCRKIILALKNEDVYQVGFTNDGRSELSKIQELSGRRIKGFSGGDTLIVGLSHDGRVFTWGNNDNGQLGLGTRPPCTPHFQQVTYLSSRNIAIRSISCGDSHTLALSTNGIVYCWGTNYSCECGHPTPLSGSVPLAGKLADELAWNFYEPHPLLGLPPDRCITDVVCSLNSSFVLTSSGEVYAFGNNESGELGIGSDETEVWTPTRVLIDAPVKKLASIMFTTLALSQIGRLYIWGLYERDYGLRLHPEVRHKEIRTPATITNIGCTFDIAAVSSEELFGVLTENGIYTWGDDKAIFKLEEDRAASNLAEVFAGRPTPCIAVSKTTSNH